MRTTVVFIEKLLGSTSSSAKHITLKEAARISGYSSDYIGQLVRSGKLSGKQVYSNIAWVTTEAALEKYMFEQELKLEQNALETHTAQLQQWWRRTTLDTDKFLRAVLWLAVVVLAIIILALLYIGSVTLDRFLTQSSLEKYETQRVIDAHFFEPVPFRLGGPPES